jgi:inhibitor of KinA sporulation pathway (predicted exonuclease)
MPDRLPTLADVCSAIAEGQIDAAVDGTMYQVNAYELRRYLNKHRPLPTITFSLTPTQDSLLCSDSEDWTTPVQTSVA